MIKLVYCIRKKADISFEEFDRYWWEEHGPKVTSVAKAIGAVRYVQSHLCAPELNAQLQAGRGLADPYDGVTEVWWESEAVMSEHSATAEGIEAMTMLLKDESTFIDFEQSRVFITEEKEVFNLRSESAS
ncbi:MAG: EthD domain-containing protein [Pseudomonadota bacterium]